MMKFTKICTNSNYFFLGLLLYPAEYAFSQNHESEDELFYGNVFLMNGHHFKNGNFSQNGFLNHMFIWAPKDALHNSASKFYGSQSGIMNQAIIYNKRRTAPFYAIIDQQGVRNRLTILQGADKQYISKNDSTVSKKNSVTIRQKGNGNSAIVIQN